MAENYKSQKEFDVKKSISYWSFPQKLANGSRMSLRNCMEQAKQAGFEAIELALSEEDKITLDSTREDMKKILGVSKKIGIEISSLATALLWSYSLTSSDKKIQKKAKDIIKKMLELASYLEVDTILIVPGIVGVPFNQDAEVVPYDIAHKRSLEALKECAKVAEECEVNIGIENVWNKFLLSPLEMKDFIDKIGSEYVGSYFDVGNVLLTGYPEQWIRILGKRIKKVHIKDFKTSVGSINGFCDLLEGDVDWREIMKALKEVGYDSHITAEIVPPYKEYPEALIYNTSKSMDLILGR